MNYGDENIKENTTYYAFMYQGISSSPGGLAFAVNDNDEVVSVSFMMNYEFIMGNDNFHQIVLNSLIQTFAPDLNSDEIEQIKTQFNMQDSLVGAYGISDNTGVYLYDDIVYSCSFGNGQLNFSMRFKNAMYEEDLPD